MIPLRLQPLPDPQLACRCALSVVHTYCGLLLPAFALLHTHAPAARWLRRVPALMQMWGLKVALQLVWAVNAWAVAKGSDVEVGG